MVLLAGVVSARARVRVRDDAYLLVSLTTLQ